MTLKKLKRGENKMELWIIYNDKMMREGFKHRLDFENIKLKIKEFTNITDAIQAEGLPDFIFIDMASVINLYAVIGMSSTVASLCARLAYKHQSSNFALFSVMAGWAEETLKEMKSYLKDANVVVDVIYTMDDFVNWIKKYHNHKEVQDEVRGNR